MKNVGNFMCCVVLLAAVCGGSAYAASVTNKDVISLLEAGMQDDVVIQAISNGEPKFDTSSAALIKLKEKGASPAVLKAILATKGGGGTATAGDRAARPGKRAAGGALNPEEVFVVVDGRESAMQYLIPGNRTAARALGFGGVASYAVLQGVAAQRRLPTPTPEFIISVPKNAQAGNYLTIASLAVRNNQTREVLTGGGFMSYSTGIHRDRVMAAATEQLANQSRAKEGFILYRVKPENPLPSGEYALVLYTGEIRTAGFFAQAANSYFDFGIE